MLKFRALVVGTPFNSTFMWCCLFVIHCGLNFVFGSTDAECISGKLLKTNLKRCSLCCNVLNVNVKILFVKSLTIKFHWH